MKQLGFLLLLSFLTISYSSRPPGILIAFENSTDQDFRTLNVNIVGREFAFINLKSGARTVQITVPKSYRYCYAQAITEKDTLRTSYDDYVGETLYTKGNLLFKLLVPEKSKYMYMTCVHLDKNFQ